MTGGRIMGDDPSQPHGAELVEQLKVKKDLGGPGPRHGEGGWGVGIGCPAEGASAGEGRPRSTVSQPCGGKPARPDPEPATPAAVSTSPPP